MVGAGLVARKQRRFAEKAVKAITENCLLVIVANRGQGLDE
jgi:hypothetical protein